MLNVNPDLQPEVTPLTTPVIVIQPPPPPPAPAAESTDPIDDDAIEAENALPDDDIDNIDDLDNLADPTAELGMEVDEEIVAPESLPAVPTPQAAPAVAAPVTAAPAPAPTPAPAAATASVPTVPTVPAAPVIPVEPATPAATSSTIPVPPAPVITPAAPNTPVSAAPVSHILVRQAQAPTTPQKPKDKIKQPRPTKPKKTIQTKIKDANTPSLIRTINRDIGKNIIRTSITTRAGASKTLTLAQAPANPGPPRVAPEHQPAPYGLWIKSNIGSGKKPTIIALHGCGGLYSTIAGERSELTPRHETMIRVFTSAGYNVFLPDSFTPRGKHGNCTEPLSSWAKSSQNDRIDVEAAIQWLSGRDDVDMKRIALFGWSYGLYGCGDT
jgi:hypothetical protein